MGVSLGHLVGALLTVPALVGVNFGKSVVFGSIGSIITSSERVLDDITADLPSSHILAAQSVFCLLVAEAVFYYLHRAFHLNKHLYARIHKIHHSWPAPVALVATYAHPVEHIFCNLGSL